jgi:hypothetical protein
MHQLFNERIDRMLVLATGRNGGALAEHPQELASYEAFCAL